MRRCVLYIVIALAVLAIPIERTDVADLHPVQTVALYRTQAGYRIETDTNDFGIGETVDAAYHNLMETTPGMIYLDTAEFFLISHGAESAVMEMQKYLKKGVRICAVVGQGELSVVSQYLSVHNDLQPHDEWKPGTFLPILDCRTERIKFLQKNAK